MLFNLRKRNYFWDNWYLVFVIRSKMDQCRDHYWLQRYILNHHRSSPEKYGKKELIPCFLELLSYFGNKKKVTGTLKLADDIKSGPTCVFSVLSSLPVTVILTKWQSHALAYKSPRLSHLGRMVLLPYGSPVNLIISIFVKLFVDNCNIWPCLPCLSNRCHEQCWAAKWSK